MRVAPVLETEARLPLRVAIHERWCQCRRGASNALEE